MTAKSKSKSNEEICVDVVRSLQIWGKLMLYLKHGGLGGDEVGADGAPRTGAATNRKPYGR